MALARSTDRLPRDVYVGACVLSWLVEGSGHVGWEESGRQAYGEVINSEVWRQAQSGVIAFNEGSTALVVDCNVGPCLLGGIAGCDGAGW